MNRYEAAKKLKEMPEEQRNLIQDVILTTIDNCNELFNVYCKNTNQEHTNIFYPYEDVGLKVMCWDILAHCWSDEWYDPKQDKWVPNSNNNLK